MVPVVLLPLALSAFAACDRGATAVRENAWHRHDLWIHRPTVEEPTDARGKIFEPRISFLGAAEVRDLSRVPPEQLAHFPHRPAGQIRAVAQRAGSRLAWRVQVGAAGYLSFVPLPAEPACACTLRVGIRDAPGKVEEIWRSTPPAQQTLAEAVVELDLSTRAGREIELLFQVDGPADVAPSYALWGSPAVYFQREAGTGATETSARSDARPNVLFIGLDTLRADRLGPWGRRPTLSPAFDRLAEESDVWLDAYSAFNVTNPSFASMMTGLYGKNHGVYDLQTPLPREAKTLAESFHDGGYRTMAILSARHLQDSSSGLGQGFDEVTSPSEHFAGELATDMMMDWLANEGQPHPKPFFAWLHLFDPHTPHTPPQPYALGFRPDFDLGLAPVRSWWPFRAPGPRGFVEDVLGGHSDLYDGEVAYLDRQLGRLLGFMESRGLLESTIVVVVADHGESLGEHGILFRHVGLHDTTTHVPLAIRWAGPRRVGHAYRGLVQTIDLFPTLLAAAGLPIPPQDGQDLRTLTAAGKPGRRVVFAEHAGQLGLMARTNEWKYLVSLGNTRFFPDAATLFDVKNDPLETANLAGRGLAIEKQMEQLLGRWLAERRRTVAPPAKPMDPEEEKRLRGLGYLR